jgi:hypothetical protein
MLIFHYLTSIDSISGEIEDAAHLVHEMAAASVALELTNDENICISCFLKNIAHFDPPMAWAFAEAPFDGDKVGMMVLVFHAAAYRIGMFNLLLLFHGYVASLAWT